MYNVILNLSRRFNVHLFKPHDRKGSFTTRLEGNVPGFKNVIKRAYYLQQPGCWHKPTRRLWPVWVLGKVGVLKEKTPQSCMERAKPCRQDLAQVQRHRST